MMACLKQRQKHMLTAREAKRDVSFQKAAHFRFTSHVRLMVYNVWWSSSSCLWRKMLHACSSHHIPTIAKAIWKEWGTGMRMQTPCGMQGKSLIFVCMQAGLAMHESKCAFIKCDCGCLCACTWSFCVYKSACKHWCMHANTRLTRKHISCQHIQPQARCQHI